MPVRNNFLMPSPSNLPKVDNKNKQKMLQNIINNDLEMKDCFSDEAASLLKLMLQKDPTYRIGNFVKGQEDDASEIRAHPFFKDIDWFQVRHC